MTTEDKSKPFHGRGKVARKVLLKQARELLVQNNAEWKSLADSGDCGNWKAEDQPTYQKTAALIEEIDFALAPSKEKQHVA